MKAYIIVFALLFFYNAMFSAILYPREVAILDISMANDEVNISSIHAVDHLMKVSGVAYVTTTNLDSAFKYRVVIASSWIERSTFTAEQEAAISNYIFNGGIFIAGAYEGNVSRLNAAFGVSSATRTRALKRMIFDISTLDAGFRWINDPMEITMSLGNETLDSVITTRYYNLTTATILGRYENNQAAIVKNSYGTGYAYILGFSFRDIISMGQSGLDFDAQRSSSNFFEPTADALMLFVKGICAANIPFALWKHTIPDKRKSALMVTHDMDSQTAMDLVSHYSTYEYSRGIIATFNITTRYFSDYLMGPFFLPAENISRLDSARTNCKHVIASHSVGHFPDMGDEVQIPLGVRDAYTSQNYSPHNNGDFTEGATLYGETQVSKELIEEAFGTNVRSWRSGHLCFPKILNNVLDTLGYEFNSTNSASDVLTNFPFRGRTSSSNHGVYTNVYEIPLTISDVFHSDEMTITNFEEKVSLWRTVVEKNMNNYSPVVLLIHPNEAYKLNALQSLIGQLPMDEMDVNGLENFGDFWKYRETVNFTSTYVDDTLTIIVPSDRLPIQHKLGLVIDGGNQLDSAKIRVCDEHNNPIPHYRYANWYENGLYIQFEPATAAIVLDISEGSTEESLLHSIFPNPFSDDVTVQFFSKQGGVMPLEIYDMQGSKIHTEEIHTSAGVNNFSPNISFLKPGMYFFLIKDQGKRYGFKGVKK